MFFIAGTMTVQIEREVYIMNELNYDVLKIVNDNHNKKKTQEKNNITNIIDKVEGYLGFIMIVAVLSYLAIRLFIVG